jgi:RNA-binding protein
VLESSPSTARELCALLCEKTGAVPVQVIGRRFVIYRPNPENPVIRLGE